MSATDQTFAVDGMTLQRRAQRPFPRVLMVEVQSGSAETPASIMADSLRKEGWTTTVASNRAVDPRLRLPTWFPEPMRRIVGFLKGLIRQIPDHDLVHITCSSARQITREALVSLVLARFFGKKVLLQFVTAEIEGLMERRRRWLMPFLKMTDGIVVGSRYLQKVFGRSGLAVGVVARPLPVDNIEHRTLADLQPRILINGRLEPDSNVACAIKAFRLVKQKYPRAELVVVGDGTQRAALEHMVERNNIYGVDFMGRLGQTETLRQYQESDLYLHSSSVDESPAALVQAFAAGLPVVSTDADGLLHMVRDGVSGLLRAVGDHVGLADSIIELIENPELASKLSAQGKVEVRKYSWSRLRQDWVNLYRSLVVE